MKNRPFVALVLGVLGICLYQLASAGPDPFLDNTVPAIPLPPQNGTSGRATVIDGETLLLGTSRFKLTGMDAPKSCELGHTEATRKLRALLSSDPVSCGPYVEGLRDIITSCGTAKYPDLSRQMIEEGYAIAWPTIETFSQEMFEAIAAHRGLWSYNRSWSSGTARHC